MRHPGIRPSHAARSRPQRVRSLVLEAHTSHFLGSTSCTMGEPRARRRFAGRAQGVTPCPTVESSELPAHSTWSDKTLLVLYARGRGRGRMGGAYKRHGHGRWPRRLALWCTVAHWVAMGVWVAANARVSIRSRAPASGTAPCSSPKTASASWTRRLAQAPAIWQPLFRKHPGTTGSGTAA